MVPKVVGSIPISHPKFEIVSKLDHIAVVLFFLINVGKRHQIAIAFSDKVCYNKDI